MCSHSPTKIVTKILLSLLLHTSIVVAAKNDSDLYLLTEALKSIALEEQSPAKLPHRPPSPTEKEGPLKDLETWTDYCFAHIPEGLSINYGNNNFPFAFNNEITALATAVNSHLEERLLTGSWYDNQKAPGAAAVRSATLNYVLMKNVQPGTEICAIGDIHGTIHPLLRLLWKLFTIGYLDRNFKISRPDFYLVFLGDLIDRGSFGLEVLYTILRLVDANSDTNRVILLRGNHENKENYQGPLYIPQFSFGFELKKRFLTDGGKNDNWSEDIFGRLFDRLPVGLFVTCKDFVIQFCHGGAMASSADDLSALDNKWRCTADCYRTIPSNLAYLLTWGDFNNTSTAGVDRSSGRPFVGADLVEKICKKQGINAFIRGHQHYKYALKLLPKDPSKLINFPEPAWWWLLLTPTQIKTYGDKGLPLASADYLPIFTLSTAGGISDYQGFALVSLKEKFNDCKLYIYEKNIVKPYQEAKNGKNLYTKIVCNKTRGVTISWDVNPAPKPVTIV